MLGGRALTERRMSPPTRESPYENTIFGDDMSDKQENNLRILTQNINRLIKNEYFHRLRLELNNLEYTQYDIFLFQEKNINWRKRGTKRKVNNILHKYQPYQITHSHCKTYEKQAFHQQGGTTTLLRNIAATNNKIIDTDDAGR